MSVVLAEAVERAVGRVLAEVNGRLEQLIDEELDRRLSLLVADRLSAVGNSPTALETLKTCRVCSEAKPVDEFERGRSTCRSCRRQQERERAGRTATEADRPPVAADVQTG